MYNPVKSARLYEQIVEQIQESITSGDLQAGQRLPPERELAEQFNVSRTAVREAVKALREKGLVEIHRGRGTFVADISNSTREIVRGSFDLLMRVEAEHAFNNLLEVRSMLEPQIAAMAAEQATAADITALEEAIETMDEALDDAQTFIRTDHEFHLILARATQNVLIPVLIDAIVELLMEQRARIFKVEGGPEHGQFHHRRILAAMKQKDPVAASQAMKAHLEQVIVDSRAAAEPLSS
jgi:GntR family transcriptional repressor for pyruvate dehydrogenase complex